MSVDENGVYIPPTIEEINNDLKQQLIAKGVDLNVFDNSNYIQTTNPISTKIYNLANNIASFPAQIQQIFNLQNILIERASIFTKDALINTLLDDPDIVKADIFNVNPGEVTIVIWSDIADLFTKDYTDVTRKIVDFTSVFGVYVDLGSAIVDSAFRNNSLQETTVYYNIANNIEIVTSDPSNTLNVTVSTFTPVTAVVETQNINNKLIEVFKDFKIGQQVETSFLISEIFKVNSNYKSVEVTFSGTAITNSDLYIYTDSNINII